MGSPGGLIVAVVLFSLPATPLPFSATMASESSTCRLSVWPGSESHSQRTSLRCRAASFSMGWCFSVSFKTLGLLWDAGVHWPLYKAVWKLLVGLDYSYNSGDMALSEAFADLTLEPC